MTPRQLAILRFIATYRQSHGYPPTQREIAAEFGIYTNGAKGHLEALRTKGMVDWERGKSRTLRVIGNTN